MRAALAFCWLPLAACSSESGTPGSQPRSGPRLGTEVLQRFDAAVDPARVALDVPGVALALVEGGKVVLARGYGTRNVESGEPVTPATVFRIGSLTKSFSSALVATLVDDDALTWDTPARDIDSEFRLPSAEQTARLTVHELLGMGTGWAEPPGFWWDFPHASDLFSALAGLEPAVPEGQYFYNNEVYSAGVYVALETSASRADLDRAYADLVTARLFEPLAMAHSAVTDDPSELGDNVAVSCRLSLADGFNPEEPTGFEPLAAVAPAGAIASNVDDLASYVLMQLLHGENPTSATPVVSRASLDVTYEPQTPVHFDSAPWLESYAAGWVVGEEAGHRVLWHDGEVDGYTSRLRLLPDDAIGLVVLTNGSNGAALATYLEETLMRLAFGESALDPAAIESDYAKVRAQLVQAGDVLGAQPAVDADAVAPFLGAYGHGIAVELADDGTLWVTAPGSRSRLVPADTLLKKDDTYLLASGPYLGFGLTFGEADGVRELTVFDPTNDEPQLILDQMP